MSLYNRMSAEWREDPSVIITHLNVGGRVLILMEREMGKRLRMREVEEERDAWGADHAVCFITREDTSVTVHHDSGSEMIPLGIGMNCFLWREGFVPGEMSRAPYDVLLPWEKPNRFSFSVVENVPWLLYADWCEIEDPNVDYRLCDPRDLESPVFSFAEENTWNIRKFVQIGRGWNYEILTDRVREEGAYWRFLEMLPITRKTWDYV